MVFALMSTSTHKSLVWESSQNGKPTMRTYKFREDSARVEWLELNEQHRHTLNSNHPIHLSLFQASHLPDRVSVLASLSSTFKHRSQSFLLQVEDSHTAVVEAYRHQVGMLLMDVKAEDARTGGVDILWEGRVLQ